MNLTTEQISSSVRKVLADHCGSEPEAVGLAQTMDDLGFDSLEHVQITMAIEVELNIDVPDDDMVDHSTTVAEIIADAAKRVGAR